MLPLGGNKVPAAHPAPSGSVSQKPPGARLARCFRPVLAGRSAWAALHAARRRQSLLWLRVAVGAHEQGNTQRIKAEQRSEGRKGVRAQRTGQRSGAGWMRTTQHDILVVTVLRGTWMCRWLCSYVGPTDTPAQRQKLLTGLSRLKLLLWMPPPRASRSGGPRRPLSVA